ncbi:glycosyltransferase family 4 protein [Viridibacterium curvum]|uniref:Glycosyltransferase family 4 protein n=1 Tax=Viridibacterium curvum TaxID=1101404 RepID=A0ABP9QJA1_9RHOO
MANPIRLAIVRSRYNPFGGAERFVERTLSALESHAINVTLIARRWDGDTSAKNAAGWRLLKCDPFHIGRVWRDRSFARGVQKLMASERFDLVQSHERIPGCDIFRAGDGVHATWLSLRARTLSSFGRWLQSRSPWHNYTLAAEDAMFRDRRLRAVICNSGMVRDDLARRYPKLAARLHVLHNGVDLERFHLGLRARHRQTLREQMGVSDATRVILYVGSGYERKGVGVLLKALARPELADAQLWVVGKDKAQQKFEALAHKLGVRERVRFEGPQQDVVRYLGAADVFALPTLYDPMPNAAMEALASGLPTLTSMSCGTAELVRALECGEVTDALDAPAVAAGLKRLLDIACSNRGEEIRAQARESVSHLSLAVMAEKQLALYGQLLSAES